MTIPVKVIFVHRPITEPELVEASSIEYCHQPAAQCPMVTDDLTQVNDMRHFALCSRHC